jgi:hypothetical protein
MTEREELMLYHGIMIGQMGTPSEPPDWAKPWIAALVERADNELRKETMQEIKDVIVGAAMKRQEN